ncbi:hypothetical protein LINPERPRIM_LOCUS21581 [Linum perenne]
MKFRIKNTKSTPKETNLLSWLCSFSFDSLAIETLVRICNRFEVPRRRRCPSIQFFSCSPTSPTFNPNSQNGTTSPMNKSKVPTTSFRYLREEDNGGGRGRRRQRRGGVAMKAEDRGGRRMRREEEDGSGGR